MAENTVVFDISELNNNWNRIALRESRRESDLAPRENDQAHRSPDTSSDNARRDGCATPTGTLPR